MNNKYLVLIVIVLFLTACSPSYQIITPPSTSSGGSSLWEQNGSDIYYNNGSVGVGTSNPQALIDAFGSSPFIQSTYDSVLEFYAKFTAAGTSNKYPRATFRVGDADDLTNMVNVGLWVQPDTTTQTDAFMEVMTSSDNTASATQRFMLRANTNGNNEIISSSRTGTSTGNGIEFIVRPHTDVLVLDKDGEVGVNTNSPRAGFHVSGTNAYIGPGNPPYSGSYALSVEDTDQAAAFVVDAPTDSLSGRAFGVGINNENFIRTLFYSNGFIGIGPGSATRDTFIGRSSANTIQIGSTYNGSGVGHLVVNGNITADSITVNGNINITGCLQYNGGTLGTCV